MVSKKIVLKDYSIPKAIILVFLSLKYTSTALNHIIYIWVLTWALEASPWGATSRILGIIM